jgi:hypothetical protein
VQGHRASHDGRVGDDDSGAPTPATAATVDVPPMVLEIVLATAVTVAHVMLMTLLEQPEYAATPIDPTAANTLTNP